MFTAARLTRRAYLETFGPVPPLPKIAFSDPWPARLIRYGSHDGYPTRFTWREAWVCFNDTTWREISPTENVYTTAVLSEQAYARNFGDVPPLPAAAFRSGWSSPLV